jgi:hypothetical protein
MRKNGTRRDSADVIDVEFREVGADTCLSRADKHVVGALFVALPAALLLGSTLDLVSIYMLPIVMTVILAVFTFSVRRRINPQVRSWVTLACALSIGFWVFFWFGSHVVAMGIGLLMGPVYFGYRQAEQKISQ